MTTQLFIQNVLPDYQLENDQSFINSLAIQSINKCLTEIFKLVHSVNDSNPLVKLPEGPVIFFNKYTPKIQDVIEIMHRIQIEINMDDDIILSAFYYVDKLSSANNFYITPLNHYRLLITSLMVSDKYNNDFPQTVLYYSQSSGLSLNSLQYTEQKFLELINFELYIKNLDEYKQELRVHLSQGSDCK